MEIPSIHVEDTSQGHQAYNNYDVLRKINALLENKLDLSTIPGMTLPTEQSTGMAAVHGAIGSQTVHPQQHTIQPPVVNTNYQAHTPQMTSPMQMSALPPSDAWASYLNSLNALQTGGLAVGGSSQPGSHHSSMQDVYQAGNIPATAPLSAMVAQQAAIMSGAMSPGAVMNRNTGGVTGGPTHQTHCDNWLDLASQAITPFTLSQVAAASAALAHNQQQQQQQQQILQQQQQQQQIQHQQQQHQLQQQQQYLQQQQQSNFYQQPCLQTQQQQQQHLQHQQQQVNFNQQASTYTSQPTQYPASVSLPVVPVSQSLLSANSESFIPGAISNRTLETLTESTMRPYRAIKGEANNYSCATGQSEPRNSPGNVGTIGDRQSPGSDGQSMSRSTSPADSDTSGYNSSQSEFSDSALVELMKSLQLTTNGNTEGQSSASQQQYYQQENINQLASLASSDLLKSLGLAPDTCKRLQSGQNSSYGTQTAPANPNDFSMSADLFASRPWNALNSLFTTSATDPNSIERAAKLYRNAAIICEPTCTWSGQLPPKVHKNPTYSCKVFLGGVPWDISENGLQHAFRSFGNIKIEWPSKDGRHPRYPPKAGYVYILFDNERAVKALLQACTHDFSNGGEYYFKISSRRMRSKEVQVIPWSLNDSNFVKQPSQRLDPQKTVFVGALHGMMNAEGLAHIMHDLFGNVLYAGIDTDKHKYPIGSGRVTFSSHKSYMKAVNAAFVEIKTSKFTKKIQIDPYLEDSKCSACNVQQGPYFCRDLSCFRYYCKACWQWYHAAEGANYHKPLMRNGRAPSGGVSGFNGPS